MKGAMEGGGDYPLFSCRRTHTEHRSSEKNGCFEVGNRKMRKKLSNKLRRRERKREKSGENRR